VLQSGGNLPPRRIFYPVAPKPIIIPTAIGPTYVVQWTFLVAMIFTSLGVAVTPEINMADKKEEVALLW